MTNWKSIPGYEGLYECSDCGKVRSLDREHVRKHYTVSLKGQVLRQSRELGPVAYKQVRLSKNGKTKLWRVHRLVAITFLGPPNGRNVLHGDEGCNVNHVRNLRYGNQRDNNLDAHRRHVTKHNKRCRRVKRSDGAKFMSIAIAASESNVDARSLRKAIIDGREFAGFTWSFLDPPCGKS